MEIHAEQSDRVLQLRISGRLDRSTTPRLREQLGRMLDASDGDVIIDLSAMPFLSAAGVRALYDTLVRLRGQGRRLVLCAPPRDVAATLRLSGLPRVLPVLNDPDTALKSILT